MKTHIATVSANGQMTIPAEVRRELGIQAGSRIAISVRGREMLVSRPLKTLDEIAGSIPSPREMTDDLDDEVEEAMSDWYAQEYPGTGQP